MSKIQRSNKEAKKPKQNKDAPKAVVGEPIRPQVVTAVMPKGKSKT
jgi:hypothetical protein